MSAELSELKGLLDITPANLHRSARVLVHELKEADWHFVTTQEGVEALQAEAVKKAFENCHQQVNGVVAGISSGIGHCKRFDIAIPAEAEGKLEIAEGIAKKIRAVTNLTGASALVATFEN